jgi:hypothetical protein
MDDQTGVVSHEEIDSIYEELTTMDVGLDPDPIRFGPKRLNGKVAAVKKLVSRCTEIEISLAHRMSLLTRSLRAIEAETDLRLQDMLANDPEVRAGRSVRDREAVAYTKLREERESLTLLKQQVEDIKSSIAVVRAKKNDLKDTQGRLRDQIRLCHEEIALGSTWGSEGYPSGVPLKSSGAGIQSEGDSVDRLIDELAVEAPGGMGLIPRGLLLGEDPGGIGETDTEESDADLEQSMKTEADGGNGKPEADGEEAQQMLDALLSNLPDGVEADGELDKPKNPVAEAEELDLDALIDGDW